MLAESIYGNGYQSLYEATINNIENELFVTGYEAMNMQLLLTVAVWIFSIMVILVYIQKKKKNF